MARVVILKDNVPKVFTTIQALVDKQVLVGIPESDDFRKEDDAHDIGNAGIGYAMEFGLPASNVPARPFLIPGVAKARNASLAQMQKAAAAALSGDTAGMNAALSNAGSVAASEVKLMIDSNIPPPLSPETIRNRRYARKNKSARKSELDYLDMVTKGVSPALAQATTGIKSLFNTGQLLRSITHVVRKVSSRARS